MTHIYLIRHCKALGQEPGAELSEEGKQQAEELSTKLFPLGIRALVSSDFKRAMSSAAPLAEALGLEINPDERLRECWLGEAPRGDWRRAIKDGIEDPELTLPGGESTGAATRRVMELIDQLEGGEALFTHGLLLTLIARRIDPEVGYEFWAELRNPDVFELSNSAITRI